MLGSSEVKKQLHLFLCIQIKLPAVKVIVLFYKCRAVGLLSGGAVTVY